MADAFEAKRIRGPIHLCSDEQAEPLIREFRHIGPDDWIVCTWRNHFHCLLKGMPEDELFAEICAGRSMFVCSESHRIVSSAIVGGGLPIAVGIGMGIKMTGAPGQVFVFCGDMCERTGLYHEATQYAAGHGLPVNICVEDNGVSTNANTSETWGKQWETDEWQRRCRSGYSYQRNYPHTGIGRHVTF